MEDQVQTKIQLERPTQDETNDVVQQEENPVQMEEHQSMHDKPQQVRVRRPSERILMKKFSKLLNAEKYSNLKLDVDEALRSLGFICTSFVSYFGELWYDFNF